LSVIGVLGVEPLRVPRPAGRLPMRLAAQMVGQLDLHRALHQSLGQPRQQPAGPDDLLLAARAGQLSENLLESVLTASRS
jgi:hypothetical protein